MAATTGLLQASMRLHTSGSRGDCGGLPNSRMSAPPMKLRPAPVTRMARRRHRHPLLDGRHQAPAHGHAQRIDRRIVDGHDQDGAGARQADGGVSPAAVDGRHAAVSCFSWFA
jgi:hypothetical protein